METHVFVTHFSLSSAASMTENAGLDNKDVESSLDDTELQTLEEQLQAEEAKLSALRHNVSKLREKRKRLYRVQPPPLVHAGGVAHTTYSLAAGNSDVLPPLPPLKASSMNHVAQQPRLVQNHGLSSHHVGMSTGNVNQIDEGRSLVRGDYVQMSHPVLYQDSKQLQGSVGEEHVRLAKRRLKATQESARQMFIHQIERSLSGIPVPRPPPDQWPLCPWAVGSHFNALVGLESIVTFIQTGKLPDQEFANPSRTHMKCSSCHTDFSPVWRLVRDSQRPCIVCERCENVRIKQALGSHYSRRLHNAFAQAEQQEKDFEAQMEQQVMEEAQRVRHEQYVYNHNEQMARQHQRHSNSTLQHQVQDPDADMLRLMVQQQKDIEKRLTLTGTTSHITV